MVGKGKKIKTKIINKQTVMVVRGKKLLG